MPANVELILDWIAALRSGETEAIAEPLDPDVVWHGVTGDLTCVGRADVIDALREQLPMSIDLDALELIRAPGHIVVGTRSEHLPEPPGVKLDGQIYNVFERRGPPLRVNPGLRPSHGGAALGRARGRVPVALIQSASGTRIDCDLCDDYAAAPSLSVEVLRRATGYVSHRGRDFCSTCWEQYTTSEFAAEPQEPAGGGPAAT